MRISSRALIGGQSSAEWGRTLSFVRTNGGGAGGAGAGGAGGGAGAGGPLVERAGRGVAGGDCAAGGARCVPGRADGGGR
ncbi:hypothetical protein E1298_34035, partial [Actinomadura rubrisoli]